MTSLHLWQMNILNWIFSGIKYSKLHLCVYHCFTAQHSTVTAWWKTRCDCLQNRQPGVLLHHWRKLEALSMNQKKRKPTWQPPPMSRPCHPQCAVNFYSREPGGRIAGSDAVGSLLSGGGTCNWEFKSDCCSLWKTTVFHPMLGEHFLNTALCTDVFARWMLPYRIFWSWKKKDNTSHFVFSFSLPLTTHAVCCL